MSRTGMMFLLVGCFASLLWWNGIASGQSNESQYARGINQFLQADYPSAFSSFEEATKIVPEDPRPYFFMGMCQSRLGNADYGKILIEKGAKFENYPKGRQYDMGMALRQVQGAERLAIEAIRKSARQQYRKEEELRQVQEFGETLNREKEVLSTMNTSEKGGTSSSGLGTGESRTANAALPTVDPISPLRKEEKDVVTVPNLYDVKNEDFVYFRDELGRTSPSTAMKKKLKELEEKVTYDDPMDRPAKDGSAFMNIYDPLNIHQEDNPFYGQDDPDDMYRDYENSPLTTTISLLEKLSGKKTGKPAKTKDGQPMTPGMEETDDMPMQPNPMGMGMGGMPGEGGPGAEGAAAATVGDNTVFTDSNDKNTFSGNTTAPVKDRNSFDFFSDDLLYTPPQPVEPKDPNEIKML